MNNSEGNKIIAEFMGLIWVEKGDNTFPTVHYEKGEDWYGEDFINYHTSWDWLMPVIEKIAKLPFDDQPDLEQGIDTSYPRTFGMSVDGTGDFMFRFNRYCCFYAPTLIDAAYNAVIDFITTNNQHE